MLLSDSKLIYNNEVNKKEPSKSVKNINIILIYHIKVYIINLKGVYIIKKRNLYKKHVDKIATNINKITILKIWTSFAMDCSFSGNK